MGKNTDFLTISPNPKCNIVTHHLETALQTILIPENELQNIKYNL